MVQCREHRRRDDLPAGLRLNQPIKPELKGAASAAPFSLSKNPGVDKGPQPLMFNPALTTCASERMKTQRFSYFADFAARERMREAKPVKLKKVAFSHFFDTLTPPVYAGGVFDPGLIRLSRQQARQLLCSRLPRPHCARQAWLPCRLRSNRRGHCALRRRPPQWFPRRG